MQYSKIGGPIVGIYKSLTDIWMQKLGMRPRSFISGKICFEFSPQYCYPAFSFLFHIPLTLLQAERGRLSSKECGSCILISCVEGSGTWYSCYTGTWRRTTFHPIRCLHSPNQSEARVPVPLADRSPYRQQITIITFWVMTFYEKYNVRAVNGLYCN